MSSENTNSLNIFDFIEFPDRLKQDEALQICDINKLSLLQVEDTYLRFFDTFFEQYSVWCYDINNFRSHLWLHFLLMYYHYFQNPLDTIDIDKFQSPEAVHKIYFDTFAEDVALYLISYFDKHLEMFNDLYDLKQLSGNKLSLSRRRIINEMGNVEVLKDLANEYRRVEQSEPFRKVLAIRNNFVHNKSSSYYGMEVTKIGRGAYASGNSSGISTKSIYKSVCELLKSYVQLCEQVNTFISARKRSQSKRGGSIYYYRVILFVNIHDLRVSCCWLFSDGIKFRLVGNPIDIDVDKNIYYQ